MSFSDLANRDLASLAHHWTDLTKFLPPEVARYYRQDASVITLPPGCDSYRAVLWTAEQMRLRQWSKAIVIAYPAHIGRVEALCKQAGITAIVPDGLAKIRFGEPIWRRWRWRLRELGAIGYSKMRGMIA